MPDASDDTDHAEALAARADSLKEAWVATLEDMDALAAEYADEGWETLTIPSGHTAPELPDTGADGRFGLAYVVPGNYVEPFETAFAAGSFPRYDVFRNEAGGQVFLVTVLADPDTEIAILVAGGFERRHSQPLIPIVKEEGTMYTHLQTLDGTELGSFEHDDPEKFFPARDFADAE